MKKHKQVDEQIEAGFTTIMVFVILVLLTGGLIVEHSRLSIIPLIIALYYGVNLLRKYSRGEL